MQQRLGISVIADQRQVLMASLAVPISVALVSFVEDWRRLGLSPGALALIDTCGRCHPRLRETFGD